MHIYEYTEYEYTESAHDEYTVYEYTESTSGEPVVGMIRAMAIILWNVSRLLMLRGSG